MLSRNEFFRSIAASAAGSVAPLTDSVGEIEPGKVYVVRARHRLSLEALENIRCAIRAVVPKTTKIIVLDDDLEIAELSPLGACEIESAVERGIRRALQEKL